MEERRGLENKGGSVGGTVAAVYTMVAILQSHAFTFLGISQEINPEESRRE